MGRKHEKSPGDDSGSTVQPSKDEQKVKDRREKTRLKVQAWRKKQRENKAKYDELKKVDRERRQEARLRKRQQALSDPIIQQELRKKKCEEMKKYFSEHINACEARKLVIIKDNSSQERKQTSKQNEQNKESSEKLPKKRKSTGKQNTAEKKSKVQEVPTEREKAIEPQKSKVHEEPAEMVKQQDPKNATLVTL
ncbi:uncharacterized protein LOC123547407 [Mercenaria mercenaria]|uniref:uncharacterized protein LOC123547407 n=1 Tax=Mercenaria mercenaria TaxID=6596 RepID=UPI00234E86E6|nr:uncharacterized protein LOC123547407 [Mercenaria mercenaria]